MNSEILNSIEGKLSIFKDLYTNIRLVDPYTKDPDDGSGKVPDEKRHCFDFWDTGKRCENCISMRAFNERKSAVKVEMRGESIYMIHAVPVELEGSNLVVEMIKDITESGLILHEIEGEFMDVAKAIKRLNEKLIIDPLTGIYNRRYMEEALPADFYAAHVSGSGMAVVMTDIDHFKSVNDTYGHDVGDEILKDFSEILVSSVRGKSDWVARYGGEEFVIAIKDVDENTALRIVDDIRRKVEEHTFAENIKVTASFGVNVPKEPMRDIQNLIKPADEALYEAKRSGRNKVVMALD